MLTSLWSRWKREIVVFGAIALVSSLSFALGYLANRESARNPIIIEKCAEVV